jgi:hypothetical protein
MRWTTRARSPPLRSARVGRRQWLRSFEPAVTLDLATDVADDAAEIGAQLLEHPVGALELLGVGARSWIAQLNASRTASIDGYAIPSYVFVTRLPQHGLNNFFRSAQTFLLLDL